MSSVLKDIIGEVFKEAEQLMIRFSEARICYIFANTYGYC